MAPRWREDARGTIVGLTRYANRHHIARAALEATAYQTREVADAMRNNADVQFEECGKGGRRYERKNDLLMQFQADMLGWPSGAWPIAPEMPPLAPPMLLALAVRVSGRPPTKIRSNWVSQ